MQKGESLWNRIPILLDGNILLTLILLQGIVTIYRVSWPLKYIEIQQVNSKNRKAMNGNRKATRGNRKYDLNSYGTNDIRLTAV
jgi:hypothetical protein